MSNHQLRRADRALTHEQALEVFNDAEFIVVSTRDAENNPYGVPYSFALSEDTLYLHSSNQGGLKIDCFRHDSRVCVTAVVDVQSFFAEGDFSTYYRSAIASGCIREVTQPVEFKKALVALCMKYSPEAKGHIAKAIKQSSAHTSVWALDIKELSGKGQLPS